MTVNDYVLVTGASGFLGSAVLRQALARGWRVRALVRASSPRANLADLPVEVVLGDMRDPAAVAAAMQGVRYLFHVAADYRLWAPDPEEIVRTNVDGTMAVMEAAQQAGVERVVYTSSVATLRVAGASAPVDETAALTPHEAIGAYKRSKVLAERVVERMVAERGLPAVIVNPSTPIGPRDVRPTPTGRIIVEAATGKIPAFVETGLNLAHVDDVAAGHIQALEHGRTGERYILGGDDVMLQQMLRDIAGLCGRRPPTVQLPRWPLYPLAHAAEAVARLTRKEPFITVDGLTMSKYKMFFRCDKARRELGYQPRPYTEGLRDALAWFREAGYLR
ncbi:Aurachin B dehydrogenase [Cupriavidus yeoncheonensis]|uniref:Aurachin B dehydrogenase n=1 Tax=Cupriavidus yeoncheonensis TaxID=1462994 RepID=A0A916ISC1_9BURK|nr:hopanoid-associated sugar epimerase [Cupriavidus yeoncheonensis]CAG2136464.1 Aurachin B dehydrogenase [Cupriavidus yeoncheonensis]